MSNDPLGRPWSVGDATDFRYQWYAALVREANRLRDEYDHAEFSATRFNRWITARNLADRAWLTWRRSIDEGV